MPNRHNLVAYCALVLLSWAIAVNCVDPLSANYALRKLYEQKPARQIPQAPPTDIDPRLANCPVIIVDVSQPDPKQTLTVERNELAKVIRWLTRHHAHAVGIDIVFDRPEPALDSDLAHAMSESGQVVLASTYDDSCRPFIEKPPLPIFQKAARMLGLVNLVTDNDGCVRYVQHHYEGESFATRQSLVLGLLRLMLSVRGRRPPEVLTRERSIVVPADAAAFAPINDFVSSLEIPVDDQGLTYLQYQGPAGTIPTIGEAELLDPGRYDKLDLRNQAVLLGNAARDQGDVHMAPFGDGLNRMIAGVEMHAQNLLGLFRAAVVQEHPEPVLRSLDSRTGRALSLLFCLAGVGVAACGNDLVAWIVVVLLFGLSLQTSEELFNSWRLFVNPFQMWGSYLVGTVALQLYAAKVLRTQKRHIEILMQTYFYPDPFLRGVLAPQDPGIDDGLVASLLEARDVLAPPGIEITGPLGVGGMSVVLAARHKDGRELALKFLAPHLFRETEGRARFEREASVAAAIQHENIVQVVQSGYQIGIPYIAYERVNGMSLRAYLDRERRVEYTEAIRIVEQVLAGLTVAHSKGIIHRDIKPENVFLTEAGVAKVLDFGIARRQTGEDLLRTRTGILLGTPSYVAPEVIRGEPAAELADIYAVGITLYELISGQPPFRRETVAGTFAAHLKDVAPPFSSFDVEVPRSLEVLILGLLDKDPTMRPASAKAASEQLAPYATSRSGGQSRRKTLVVPAEPTLAIRPTTSGGTHASPTIPPVLQQPVIPQPRNDRRESGPNTVGEPTRRD